MAAKPLNRRGKGHPPLRVQIVDDLRRRIRDPKDRQYGVGEQLPAQWEIVEEYGVSKATVTQAFELLVEQGVIETTRGEKATVLGGSWKPNDWEPGDSARIDKLEAAVKRMERTLGTSAKDMIRVEGAVHEAKSEIAHRVDQKIGELRHELEITQARVIALEEAEAAGARSEESNTGR